MLKTVLKITEGNEGDLVMNTTENLADKRGEILKASINRWVT